MIDLAEFCEDLPWWEFDSSRPFSHDGYTYATDARICIRTPTPKEDDTPSRGRPFPQCAEVFLNFPLLSTWEPWPDEAYFDEIATCAVCLGNGQVLIGNTFVKCTHCDGKGTWISQMQRVGPKVIDARYDGKVRELSCLEYSTRPEFGYPIYIRFKGGEGMIAPIAQPEDTGGSMTCKYTEETEDHPRI
ncbi:MAG TPA: hypothetical protein VFE47_01925 [Tepidisphaeraceae bacterium]|nr:hypothetical protein [Tepidisphaeraceae bacterium]